MEQKQILMLCPVTNEWVGTNSFAASLDHSYGSSAVCSACGDEHTWAPRGNMREGWVEAMLET